MLFIFKEKLKNDGEVYLRIKARPSARNTSIRDIIEQNNNGNGEIVKIDISSPPERGRANQELIRFLAEEFAVSEKNVKIVNGSNSKVKLVKITDNP